MITYKAYFRTSADAKKAQEALRLSGVRCDDPTMVEPVNGRGWLLVISAQAGVSDKYPSPDMMNLIVKIISTYNGSTASYGV